MKTQIVTSMLALSLLTNSAFMGGMQSARADQPAKEVPVAASSSSTTTVEKSSNKPLKKERRKMKKEVKTSTTTDQGVSEKKAN